MPFIGVEPRLIRQPEPGAAVLSDHQRHIVVDAQPVRQFERDEAALPRPRIRSSGSSFGVAP
jgi:hypothetical protein